MATPVGGDDLAHVLDEVAVVVGDGEAVAGGFDGGGAQPSPWQGAVRGVKGAEAG